jgi:uncharacterized damage-inducible protein DinB
VRRSLRVAPQLAPRPQARTHSTDDLALRRVSTAAAEARGAARVGPAPPRGRSPDYNAAVRRVQLVETLSAAPALLEDLVRATPAERLRRRPSAGKWSIHEHVCHLAAVGPLFSDRLTLMLTENNPAIVPYDPPPDEQAGSLLERDLDAELQRFVDDRARLVQRLEGLTDAAWRRTATHGGYTQYDVHIMFRHVMMHDLLHAYRIEELALTR